MSNQAQAQAQPRALLIVDDDLLTRRTLARTLADPAYTILEAGSVAEAMQVLEQHPVSVMLSDQHMTGGDGTELLDQVRRKYSNVVRLMLTSDSTTDLLVRAVNDGQVRRLLYKPWDDGQLRTVVRQSFGLPRNPHPRGRVHVLREPRPSSMMKIAAMLGVATPGTK